MAHHLKCPFCPQSPAVGYFYKHLISQHITSLFDETTEWGKQNLRWLNATKVRTTPYTIYLPKNEYKYCCPACCSSFNKAYYADKHIKCAEKSHEKLEEYKLCLKITPAEAPFADELRAENASALSDDDKAKYEFRETVYKKIIWNLLIEVGDKEEWCWWFNKMTEKPELHQAFQEMRDDGMEMSEDDKYNIYLECNKEMKLLGLTYDQLREVGRKKLPTPPS